jgi:hypothetical protein
MKNPLLIDGHEFPGNLKIILENENLLSEYTEMWVCSLELKSDTPRLYPAIIGNPALKRKVLATSIAVLEEIWEMLPRMNSRIVLYKFFVHKKWPVGYEIGSDFSDRGEGSCPTRVINEESLWDIKQKGVNPFKWTYCSDFSEISENKFALIKSQELVFFGR